MVGVGSIGSALCHRELVRLAFQTLPPDQHPTVSIHSLPLKSYLDAVERDDWRQVAGLLRQSADLLAAMGAQVCFTPDNMVQHALPMVTHGSPVQWVSMPEVVAQSVADDKRQRVGIIGAPIVTSGSTYQAHLGVLGVRIAKPEERDARRIGEIVVSELAWGVYRDEAHQHLLAAVDRMREAGCDAVLFGCSESPLLTERGGWSLPTYDASALVAREVLRVATAPEAQRGDD